MSASVGTLFDKFPVRQMPVSSIDMREGAYVPGGIRSISKRALKDLASGDRAPILVRPLGDRYQLIAGDNEFLAALGRGQESIQVYVCNVSDMDALLMRLREAGQRQDLNPIEEAEIILALNKDYGMTQQEIAVRCGKVQSTMANKLRLLNLPAEIVETLRTGGIGERHARALLKIKDTNKLMKLFQRCQRSKLSATEIEAICKIQAGGRKEMPNRSHLGVVKDPRIYQNALRSVVWQMQKAGLDAVCDEDSAHGKWEFRLIVTISEV